MAGAKASGARLWLLLAAVLSIGGGSTTVTMAQEVKSFVEITKYFGNIADDRTKVTWAHRANSRQALTEALNNDTIHMVEADVSYGKVNKTGDDMPVMAHELTDNVDLSLKEFLKIVNDTLAAAGNKKKGVKLDFKSEMAFNKSRDVIQEARKMLVNPYPLWLNADILKGPNGDKENVNPDVFLNESSILFPTAGLSVGWTTKVSTGDKNTCYTSEHFQNMLTYLKKYNLHNADNVTLAVRAIYAGRCKDELTKFLKESLTKATLTLWTGDTDTVTAEPLRDLVTEVKKNRVYVDLPEDMRSQVVNNTKPGGGNSSGSRIGSIASLIVLPFSLALCRLQ